MTDYLHDTEALPLNTWCPECSGPVLDEKATMAYCVMHMPSMNTGHVGYWGEAGGAENKVICDFLHRKEINPNVSIPDQLPPDYSSFG